MEFVMEFLGLLWEGVVWPFWWLWAPILLSTFFFKLWLNYSRATYWKNTDWVLLEIVPPKLVKQSPKAAENIFAGLWSFHGTVATKVDKYIKGVIQEYFTLEIVGIDGFVHFFIRCPRNRRNHVEAQIYGQYPDAEIFEVEDYARKVPDVVKSPDWDVWGASLRLDKADAYPIRTYHDFIDLAPLKGELAFIDPLASLIETLSKLRKGEQIWIQINCRPVADDWKVEGVELIKSMMGNATPPKVGLLAGVFKESFSALGLIGDGNSANAPAVPKAFLLSEAERNVIKAIDRSISKKGFQCKMNIVYLGRKEVFSKTNVAAVMGVLNQFNDLNLNGFKTEADTITKANYFFVEQRLNFKKRLIFESSVVRQFFEKGFILNTEELATVFHFPALSVEAPRTPHIQAKKSGAPSTLPIEQF